MHIAAARKAAAIRGSHRHQGYGIKGQWIDGRGFRRQARPSKLKLWGGISPSQNCPVLLRSVYGNCAGAGAK